MDRLKHVHLVLILGISLLIPMLMAYSLYVDLSETVLLSSGINFEDFGDEDSSVYMREFNVFVPTVSSVSFLPGAQFHSVPSVFLSSVMQFTQIKPVLRC
jgi:hypothetical protein